MKRLLSGLAVAALFSFPAMAQPVALTAAGVVAFCAAPNIPLAACQAQLRVFLLSLPAAERRAAFTAIAGELDDIGIEVVFPSGVSEVVVTIPLGVSGGGASSPDGSRGSPN